MTGSARSIREFMLNGFALEAGIRSVERRQSGDDLGGLGTFAGSEIVSSYVDQLDDQDREDARFMAQYYEVFYLIENMLRRMVSDTMEATHGENWWDDKVPLRVKEAVQATRARELDSSVTPRSGRPLDFTTFGELSVIISSNGDAFGGMFKSQRAAERVISLLNTLRGPIAHCGYLADDEVARLYLAVRDLFRLMA